MQMSAVLPWMRKGKKSAKRNLILQRTLEQFKYLANIYRPYTFYAGRCKSSPRTLFLRFQNWTMASLNMNGIFKVFNTCSGLPLCIVLAIITLRARASLEGNHVLGEDLVATQQIKHGPLELVEGTFSVLWCSFLLYSTEHTE